MLTARTRALATSSPPLVRMLAGGLSAALVLVLPWALVDHWHHRHDFSS